MTKNPYAWEKCKLGEVLIYEQPTKYIVENTNYEQSGIPVLTAGKTFILGYTQENFGIKQANKNNPVIIFDDFTTSSHLVDFPFKIKSSAMKILKENPNKGDLHFLFNSLNNIRYEPQSHERHWISKFSEFEISTPTLPEQQKIGALFRRLDRLITLHKRKWDDVILLKKALLQKMFPKNGSDFPEIRFPEFTDAWEKCKLGKIAIKVTEKNKDGIFQETLTNSAEFGVISQRDFFDKDISNPENLNGYYIVKPNDFVYNPRISNLAPVGPIKRNQLNRIGIMSPLYFIFRVSSNIDLDFLDSFFSTNLWHLFMKLNGDSGARADRIAIKDKIFMEMPISFPTLSEQQKIGNLFKQLDRLITLHK
ncbi:restriction endonuclease subunit S [Gallibacterium anatis]|uniref:restriction endonuclease subunit S n=1 Tax=Gallibacterium anatis TaxID=750 RepID=UPI003005C133